MAERGNPVKIGVRELRGRLGDYLHQAKLGARFLIVSRGEPVAELGAPTEVSAAPTPRQAGLLKGQIWMAEDFERWPEEFLESMQSSPIEPAP